MNKTFVAELENHEVYLVSNDKISFYINISKVKGSTNITLDVNTGKRNVLEKVINYYEKIDNYNITLVIPLINLKENFEDFKQQSNLISKLINTSHKILTKEGVMINEVVNIIKHRNNRSDFIDFFVKEFSSRLKYITLDDLVHEEVPYNKINAANISFVIGKPELELTIKDDEMKEIINEIEKNKEKEAKIKDKKISLATTGYISYYLLGFLTAIITLLVITLFMNKM